MQILLLQKQIPLRTCSKHFPLDINRELIQFGFEMYHKRGKIIRVVRKSVPCAEWHSRDSAGQEEKAVSRKIRWRQLLRSGAAAAAAHSIVCAPARTNAAGVNPCLLQREGQWCSNKCWEGFSIHRSFSEGHPPGFRGRQEPGSSWAGSDSALGALELPWISGF